MPEAENQEAGFPASFFRMFIWMNGVYSDMKYDSAAKNNAIVMTDGTGCQRVAALLWVRMDSRYKVDAQTDTIIRISKR